MRVLVTGGAGYIGSCTVEELLDAGHEVRVLDSCLWGKDSINHLSNRVELVEGDTRNASHVAYAAKDMDACIHLAGIVGDPACRKNPTAHYTANVEATNTVVNVLTDPEAHLVRDFVFASSCSVYGNAAGLYDEVTEQTPTNPLSAYADGKLRSEKIIWKKAAETPNFHPTILRLTTLFGWSPRPRLDLVTNLFAHQALTEGEINIFGDGQQYRSLINVRDVARALTTVLAQPRFRRDRRTFHVGDERNNKTVKEIAELVAELVPGTKVNFRPGEPTDKRDYKINCTLIRNCLDWERKFSVEDGISEVVENLKRLKLDYDPQKHSNAEHDYV